MKRKQVYLTEAIDRQLKQFARRQERSESELIREALEEYFARRDAADDPWQVLVGLVEDGASEGAISVDEVVYGLKVEESNQ